MMRCLAFAAGFVGLVLASSRPSAQGLSEQPKAHFPVPNGPVTALAQRAGNLFVGGRFDRVGTYTGPFAVLGRARGTTTRFPGIHGEVFDVVSDGAGGWFVAGFFNQIGAERRSGVVRFLADGTLSSWNPRAGGAITALLRVGSTLYLGGRFSIAGGRQQDLAAVDVDSAALLSWNPLGGAPLGSSESVSVLASAGSAVIVGGFFQGASFGGATRSHVAVLDAGTGAALPGPSVNGSVRDALATPQGLFLAGNFSEVAGVPRERLAWVRPDGSLAPALPAPNSDVLGIALVDSTLYFGGSFTAVSGVPRAHLAAIELRTLRLTPFAPEVAGYDGAGTAVLELELDGRNLLVGGSFQTIAGVARRSFAALDATGTVLPTDPRLAGEPITTVVHAVASTGGALAFGGNFLVSGAERRVGLAAYELATGALLPWAPEAADVLALAFDGRRLFVGGTFGTVNGVVRPRLAVVDSVTGALEAGFDAGFCSISDAPGTLACDGTRLFVAGGCLAQCGGSCRSVLALDARSGSRVPDFEVEASVRRILLSSDHATLYLAGSFEQVGDPRRGFVPRDGLAAIETVTGMVLPWDPGSVLGDGAALLAGDGSILAGGTWQALGGAHRYVAELDPTTGLPSSWDPLLTGFGSAGISALARNEELVFLAGSFSSVQGQASSNLAAVDAVSGAPLAWSPDPVGIGPILWTKYGLVVAGGEVWKHDILANLCLFESSPGAQSRR